MLHCHVPNDLESTWTYFKQFFFKKKSVIWILDYCYFYLWFFTLNVFLKKENIEKILENETVMEICQSDDVGTLFILYPSSKLVEFNYNCLLPQAYCKQLFVTLFLQICVLAWKVNWNCMYFCRCTRFRSKNVGLYKDGMFTL